MDPVSTSSDSDRPSRLRWVMIGFAFLATVINYLDRQTLSVVAPALREEFGMSNKAYDRASGGGCLVLFALGPLRPLPEFQNREEKATGVG